MQVCAGFLSGAGYFYRLILITLFLNPYPALVSVICLCYNQGRFVREALFSVINQTYPHIELLVVDDASTDNSLAEIQNFVEEHPQVRLLVNDTNLGNCRSFNRALALARGKYVIDLAADDVLVDTRVSRQVSIFEALGNEWGVVFSNALHINEQSQVIGYHFPVDRSGRARVAVPSGDVYADVLRRYFISTPTMMIRKSVLEQLGGYDEHLSYEDFDFWVRSARKYQYYYQDELLTMKRRVKGSLSAKFYEVRKNELLQSTLTICRKALQLNRTPAEQEALAVCVRYHLRQCFYTQNFDLVFQYAQLLEEMRALDRLSGILVQLSGRKVNVTGVYRTYLKLLNTLRAK
jgi:glycosyltransferase involved in cell wall biosynthesis